MNLIEFIAAIQKAIEKTGLSAQDAQLLLRVCADNLTNERGQHEKLQDLH